MSGRQVVEKLVGRMYKDYEKVNGRLPGAKAVRVMEQKAVKAATKVDRKR
jgi:hypothetical protein